MTRAREDGNDTRPHPAWHPRAFILLPATRHSNPQSATSNPSRPRFFAIRELVEGTSTHPRRTCPWQWRRRGRLQFCITRSVDHARSRFLHRRRWRHKRSPPRSLFQFHLPSPIQLLAAARASALGHQDARSLQGFVRIARAFQPFCPSVRVSLWLETWTCRPLGKFG